MKTKFKIGDVVCLHSSPKLAMTVYNVTSNGTVVAKYFDCWKILRIGTFNPNILDLMSKN